MSFLLIVIVIVIIIIIIIITWLQYLGSQWPKVPPVGPTQLAIGYGPFAQRNHSPQE